jgi:hypothetical protein
MAHYCTHSILQLTFKAQKLTICNLQVLKYYLSLQSQIIVIHVRVVAERVDIFRILIIPRVMTQVKTILYQNTYKALKIEYKYTLSYILEIMSVR